MKIPAIFSNRQFKVVAIVTAIVALLILLLNIFVIGGDAFIYTFNSSINPPLAILITVFAASILRHMSRQDQSHHLWAGMIAGWALWALAETLWIIYTLLSAEVPYPSLADLFWVLGYIPMGFGLITRIRTMPTKPKRVQGWIIWGSLAILLIITAVFVFLPVIQYFDSSRLMALVFYI
jgi:hypothetical protein